MPDFYHHSQADYNVYCTTVNLSYVMNINVVGLLGGPQLVSVTCGLWDEVREGGREGGRRCCPRPHSLPGCSLFLIPGKTWPTWLEFIFKTSISLAYICPYADIAYNFYVFDVHKEELIIYQPRLGLFYILGMCIIFGLWFVDFCVDCRQFGKHKTGSGCSSTGSR